MDNNNKQQLSERAFVMMLQGARDTGTFCEGVDFLYEQFYAEEISLVKEFAKYLDEEIGGASRMNIHRLFQSFVNPTTFNKTYAKVVKEQIEKIKSF
jgi:hypothetical protein